MVVLDDSVTVTYLEACAEICGTADELGRNWLILSDWPPTGRKRKSCSYMFDGWWGYEDDCDWDRRPPRVGRWHLDRLKGGRLRLVISPRYFRHFVGGPYDPEQVHRALAHHRRMIRARTDAAFARFVTAALAPPEDLHGRR